MTKTETKVLARLHDDYIIRHGRRVYLVRSGWFTVKGGLGETSYGSIVYRFVFDTKEELVESVKICKKMMDESCTDPMDICLENLKWCGDITDDRYAPLLDAIKEYNK